MNILYDHQMFALQKFGGISRIFIELMRELSLLPECSLHWYRGWHKDAYDITDYQSRLTRYWGLSQERLFFKQLNPDLINRFFLQLFIQTARQKYSIYHPTYYQADLVEIVKPQKLVITIHDMILEKFLSNLERFQPQIQSKKILAAKADLILVNSESTKQDLIEILAVDPEKIALTPWATRIQDIPPAELPAICQQKPYFLYVGTRSKYKNFEILIQAFGQDAWLRDNFRVICFGGTGDFTEPELKLLKQTQTQPNFVYLAGDDSLLKTLYLNAQALVYTSRYEGFGLPLLEAMVCNCPVVCCPTSSLPEVIGDAALFFDPDSAAELSEQLHTIVEDTQQRQINLAKGKDRSQLFSWTKTAKLTLAAYRQILP